MIWGTMLDSEGPGDAECSRPDLNRSVTWYCFGDLSQEERERFEAHLVQCDLCWAEVERLGRAVQILRSDRRLTRSVFLGGIASCLGSSGKLRKSFGGHIGHVLTASLLYALLFAVALPLEVAFQIDRYGPSAAQIAVLIFIWICGTTMLAMFISWKALLRNRKTGLFYSMGTIALAALILYLAVRPFLPAESITKATFQTYTAQSAYLKSIFYYLPFAAIFVLVPFQFVLAMQAEFVAGRHSQGLGLLTGSKMAVPPKGTIVPRLAVLTGLLILGAIVSITMAAHLLDNLKTGRFANVFIHIYQIRWCLYLVLGLESLFWYYLALTELKREAIAVERISAHS